MSESVIDPIALDVLCERRGVTRAVLAERVSVHPQALAKWARRERGMGADDVRACAAALDLTDAEELALARWAAVRP